MSLINEQQVEGLVEVLTAIIDHEAREGDVLSVLAGVTQALLNYMNTAPSTGPPRFKELKIAAENLLADLYHEKSH